MNAFWSDIETRFFKLHSEQRSANGLVHAINCDDSWKLGGPEDLQKKFLSIVRHVAVRLGCAADKNPLWFWLDLLKKHGVGYDKMNGSTVRRRGELDSEQVCSIEYERHVSQGGVITLLCKVSAEYCIECDTTETAAAKATAVGRQIFAAEKSDKTAALESSLASWSEIEIAFLSDERVEICRDGGKNRETRNYGELGFEDRRNGKPNRAWVTLREIARKSGTMPRPSAGKNRAMIQKRIEEIREKLRSHFRIETDPIPFNANTYQASFTIGCRPSLET
jgi:hypothetical protein